MTRIIKSINNIAEPNKLFRIKDDGTGRGITLNAIFTDYTGNMPSTTTASKTLYFSCRYNSSDTKWDILAVQEQP